MISEMNVSKLIDLLWTNHNLILTGAPGTGKTYLAKEIAKNVICKEVTLTPIDVLKRSIKKFLDEENKSDSKELLEKFYKRFPKNKLKEMSLEDYCVGKGDFNKDNFCYWIETKLKSLGTYSPGSAKSYLIYWSKYRTEYVISGYLKDLSKEKGVSDEELMVILADDIHKMINNNDPYSYVEKFGNSFMLKLLNTYYPDIYAPVNSENHIENIISIFQIKCEKDDVFEKNKAIYRFYKEQCKETNISPFDFFRILYDNFNIKGGEIKQQDEKVKIIGSYDFVQFHPSYDYTDFVEGLRPRPMLDDNNNVGFVREDGVFKKFCKTAIENPNKNYVFIIDEINRGEISKIFGELFFSIDPGYRGKKGSVRTQYANMQTEPNEFDISLGITDENNYGHFFIPENVYIIGTMNDIDRSVESMDFAFRRRFAFKEIKASENIGMLDNLDPSIKDEAIKRMTTLNNAIEKIEGLTSAYHIGASYFLKLKNYNNSFKDLWDYHLEGLLREYLRGNIDVDEKIKELKIAYKYDQDVTSENK